MKLIVPPTSRRERTKLLLLSALLLIMLAALGFAAVNTIHAAQSFQQDYKAAKTKDVRAIDPWMTIHVISNIYHVPEDYLYHSLNLNNSVAYKHVTLYTIAARKKQSVNQVIRALQHAILIYQKAHPTPTVAPRSGSGHPSHGRIRT